MGIPPALFCLVEPVEFYEAVDLLRDSGVQVPVVVIILAVLAGRFRVAGFLRDRSGSHRDSSQS